MNLFDFLRELSANNNRPWFQEHKAQYDQLRQQWISDLDRMIAAVAQWEPSVANYSGKAITFRIYRDTRFSKDKTPYKDYFSASFSATGKHNHGPGWYLHVAPEGAGLYAGIWLPESDQLNKLRHAIVDNIEEWEEVFNGEEILKALPEESITESLKTIPKGWDKNHPQARYLRMKDYGRWRPLDEKFFLDPNWPQEIANLARPAKPFVDFLDYSLSEEVFNVNII